MRGFVAHEFHEPLGCLALDFEDDLFFEPAKPFVNQKERNENGGDADGDKPLIAHVTGWHEDEALCFQLVVKLLDERLQAAAFEGESERSDVLLKQAFVRKVYPAWFGHIQTVYVADGGCERTIGMRATLPRRRPTSLPRWR